MAVMVVMVVVLVEDEVVVVRLGLRLLYLGWG